MPAIRPSQASTARRLFVSTLLGLSGAAALVGEVCWVRLHGGLFGRTAQSSALVVGLVMLGMAVGSWSAARVRGGLAAYGRAEMVAGLGALLIPVGYGWIEQHGLGWPWALRLAVCGLLLLLPAVAVGASWPWAARWASQSGGGSRAVSWLYAVNTLGAVVGLGWASAFGLWAVGVWATARLAAMVSMGCGVAAWLAAQRWGHAIDTDEPHEAHAEPASLLWDAAAFGSGFLGLAVQILAMRVLGLVLHNTTYSFALITGVSILGLSIGGWVVGWPRPRRVAPHVFATVGAGIAALALPAGILGLIAITGLRSFAVEGGAAAYVSGALALAMLVVLPASIGLGMVLPAAWDEAASRHDRAAVGRRNGLSALGAAAGSLLAGFVLGPTLGPWWSVAFVATGALGMGLAICAWSARQTMGWREGGVSLVVLAIAGAAVWVPSRIAPRFGGLEVDVLAEWESVYGRIDVVEEPTMKRRLLRQNIHYALGSIGWADDREYREAHLPILLHREPRRVLFLGLGTGMTAAGALAHEAPERIEVVELIPEVVEAARWFEAGNLGLLHDPRVIVRTDDARHDLMTGRSKFDVIVADLFVPWDSQTGYLYTVEHFQAARARLGPGGLFCQWLPLYQLGPREFEMIAESLAEVFPHVGVWWGDTSSSRGVVALVATDRPLVLDRARAQAQIDAWEARGLAPDPGLANVDDLASRFAGVWPRHAGSPINTDERPRVEFLAPLTLSNRELLKGREFEAYRRRVLDQLPRD